MEKLLSLALLASLLAQAQAIPAPPVGHFSAGALPQDRRCSIAVSSPEVDFGTRSRWQMENVGPGSILSPGVRTLTLSVSCPFSQAMHVSLRGTPGQDGNLRYGRAGIVRIRMHDAQLDGQPVKLIPVSHDRIRQDSEQNSLPLKLGSGVLTSRNGSIISGKTFTVHLEVRLLMPESEARVSTLQQSETQLTIDLSP